MQTKRVFLFDVDGTLVDTGGCGRRAFTRAFQAVFGVPDAFEGISFSGQTDPWILRTASTLRLGRLPSQDEETRFFSLYVAWLEEEVASSRSYQVYPGVESVLHALSSRPDCVLGLCTGNIEQGARLKLARGGLDRFFSFGGFGSDDADRPGLTRIALERARASASGDVFATVIGDSPLDALAAKANGLRVVLVATGWTPLDELAACRPDALLPSMADWELTIRVFLGLSQPITVGTDELERAVAVVRSGGVVLHPTMGVYGIGGNALDGAVAERVARIKGGRAAPFLVLAADRESAFALAAEVSDSARILAASFWPGGLTLALPARRLPAHLIGPGGTVAVRVDGHPFTRALVREASMPIISSSANQTGAAPVALAAHIAPAIAAACDLVVVDNAPLLGLPSTLVGFEGDEVRVLRPGVISEAELRRALARGC